MKCRERIIIRRRARWFIRPSKHELGYGALGESRSFFYPLHFSLLFPALPSLSLSLFLSFSRLRPSRTFVLVVPLPHRSRRRSVRLVPLPPCARFLGRPIPKMGPPLSSSTIPCAVRASRPAIALVSLIRTRSAVVPFGSCHSPCLRRAARPRPRAVRNANSPRRATVPALRHLVRLR